jgi:hypothetical protein
MRRGRPGRWTIEASTRESALYKVEAAGVTLAQVEPIGQITSAVVASALAPRGSRTPARPRRPVGWIAACAACAILFGAGGYWLGAHFAPVAAPATARVETSADARNAPITPAIAAAGKPIVGARNKGEVGFR